MIKIGSKNLAANNPFKLSMMGKASIILTVVIVLGLLANVLRTELVGGPKAVVDNSNFQAASQSYKTAYAAFGQHYRSQKIALNGANLAQLIEVPGIGPVLAKKIIDYRQKNGYFRTLSELQKVSGVGPKLIRRWAPIFEISIDDAINSEEEIVIE